MTIWTLAALPTVPFVLWAVGLATGATEPPRWWRRRKAVRHAGARIAAVLNKE